VINPKVKSYLFAISIVINIIAFVFFIRRVYYQQTAKPHTVASTTKPAAFYREVKRKMYSILPITKEDIVFIGDSEIELFRTHELLPGYRIKNRGIGGDDIYFFTERLPETIAGHPKEIFIEIGTNNMSDCTLDTFKVFINKVAQITKSKSPTTKIFFQSILPREAKYSKKVNAVNNVIKAVCKKSNLTYVDVYSTLSDKKGVLKKEYDCGDQLHLSPAGYLKWVEVLKGYL